MCFFMSVVVFFLFFFRALDGLCGHIDDGVLHVLETDALGVLQAEEPCKHGADLVVDLVGIAFRYPVGSAQGQERGILPEVFQCEQHLVLNTDTRIEAALGNGVLFQFFLKIFLYFSDDVLYNGKSNTEQTLAVLRITFQQSILIVHNQAFTTKLTKSA